MRKIQIRVGTYTKKKKIHSLEYLPIILVLLIFCMTFIISV